MWDAVSPYVIALLPTVAVGVLFYFLIKSILEGDRRERLAHSKWERDQEREREKERAKELERENERDAPNTPHNSPSRPE
jgi:hypothetical protein